MKTQVPDPLTIPPITHDNGEKECWCDPVTSIKHIAANPCAWVNHTVAIHAAFPPPIRQHDDTWLATTRPFVSNGSAYCRGNNSIEVQLTPDAHAYYLERKKLHAPSIYLGEVIPNPDGTFRLLFHKGLTTALRRPVCGFPHSEAPPLKIVP